MKVKRSNFEVQNRETQGEIEIWCIPGEPNEHSSKTERSQVQKHSEL